MYQLMSKSLVNVKLLMHETIETATKAGMERGLVAEACGASSLSLFARATNPGDTPAPHAEWVLPLIKFTRDPRILEWLARETWNELGLILVKDHPKKILKSGPDLKEHRNLVESYALMLQEWKAGKVNDLDLIRMLDLLRSELIAVRNAVKTKNAQQGLEF